MSQSDIGLGLIKITYGFAPLKEAEFIVNSIVIKKIQTETIDNP
jgi:hypothetical protein